MFFLWKVVSMPLIETTTMRVFSRMSSPVIFLPETSVTTHSRMWASAGWVVVFFVGCVLGATAVRAWAMNMATTMAAA